MQRWYNTYVSIINVEVLVLYFQFYSSTSIGHAVVNEPDRSPQYKRYEQVDMENIARTSQLSVTNHTRIANTRKYYNNNIL